MRGWQLLLCGALLVSSPSLLRAQPAGPVVRGPERYPVEVAPTLEATRDEEFDPNSLITPPDDVLDSRPEEVGEDDLSRMAADFEERLKKVEDSLSKKDEAKPEKPKEKKWYEKLGIRGYAQFRYNPVLVDDGEAPPQHVGDSSVRDDQTFLIRRARLILFGDVSDHLSLYFQSDFAVTPPNSPDATNFAQLRDLYGDIYLDDDREFRVRLGQSKVPFGWENLQSSQNRLPLDRADGLNSAVRNERDLGAFFYWTPTWAQERFKYIMDEGLKGSGNYGVFGIGPYAGQGGSLREQNDNLHLVARLTLPLQLENGQLMEIGVQGYTGEYTVLSSPISPLGIGPAVRPAGTLETGNQDGLLDQRIAGTFVWYAQPWGFQSEWNVGRGPGLNDEQTAVVERPLYGGYAMTMYRIQTEDCGEFWPFLRWSYFKGGYKTERNAPFSHINEWDIGMEWQINKYLEVVTTYTITDRTNTTANGSSDTLSYGQFEGQLLRLQAQINY